MGTGQVAVLRSTALVLAGLFVGLAGWIASGRSLAGDRWALVELDEVLGTAIDEPMIWIGDATDSVPIGAIALIAVALLALVGRRSDALTIVLVVGTVLALNPVLKDLVGRGRPDVRLSPEVVSIHGFPSGHAANTAALVGALLLVAEPGRSRVVSAAVGGVALAVVAFSRLATGVHYPSDLVGGWLWVASMLCIVWSARASAAGLA